jgi:hypothetical protein
MNNRHRFIGFMNLLFLVLLAISTFLPWASILSSTLGGASIILSVVVFFFVCIVWGVANTIGYRRRKGTFSIFEYVLLGAPILNALLLIGSIGAFIYIGEN